MKTIHWILIIIAVAAVVCGITALFKAPKRKRYYGIYPDNAGYEGGMNYKESDKVTPVFPAGMKGMETPLRAH